MTLDAAIGARPRDRRTTISCKVGELGLSPLGTEAYVRAIAGPMYKPRTDTLTISVERHADPALNRRESVEQLLALVQSAQELLKQHGPFQRERQYVPYFE